jgi:hypothetical protein
VRLACLSLLAFGCALRPNDPPPAPLPSKAGATAAISGDSADAGGDETAGCASDADCALTRVPPGGCCPMLCTPRAVTRKRADALEAAIAICEKGRNCPQPLCRPPTREITAACVEGRCVAKGAVLPQ